MVNNLKPCAEEDALKNNTNGGALDYDQAGEFAYLPIKTYYNSESITNVLSLKAVSEMKGYCVTMDTQDNPSIKLYHGHTTLCFPHSSNGLYYCTEEDMTRFKSKLQMDSRSTISEDSLGKPVSFLQAHSKKDTDRAIQVWKLQQQMMWPSDEAMKSFLRQGMIKDADFTPKDIDNAVEILGKPEATLKGKTTAASMTRDVSQQVMLHDIPGLKEHMVKLYIDLFYVNGVPFLHTNQLHHYPKDQQKNYWRNQEKAKECS